MMKGVQNLSFLLKELKSGPKVRVVHKNSKVCQINFLFDLFPKHICYFIIYSIFIFCSKYNCYFMIYFCIDSLQAAANTPSCGRFFPAVQLIGALNAINYPHI